MLIAADVLAMPGGPLGWGSSIPVSDHQRLLGAPWGRVAKPLVNHLMPVPSGVLWITGAMVFLLAAPQWSVVVAVSCHV